MSVRRPFGRVLSLEQVLDQRELVGGREDLGRLGVPERAEPLAEDQVPESLERDDVEAGE